MVSAQATKDRFEMLDTPAAEIKNRETALKTEIEC